MRLGVRQTGDLPNGVNPFDHILALVRNEAAVRDDPDGYRGTKLKPALLRPRQRQLDSEMLGRPAVPTRKNHHD